MFDLRCQENGIERRLTKIKHPYVMVLSTRQPLNTAGGGPFPTVRCRAGQARPTYADLRERPHC
jgi:hypothetical protein